MIDKDARRRAISVVRVFESGSADGDYSATTILPDGAGISYGVLQATDRSETLDRIVLAYLDAGGTHADALRPYLGYLARDDTTRVDPKRPPPWCLSLMAILRAAGDDPVMRTEQEAIFDEGYVQPAVAQASSMGLSLPLSLATLIDTCVQSGPGGVARIRKRFPELPPARGGDERAWTVAYLRARRAWLAAFTTPAVARTTYRPDAFLALVADDNWDLQPPLIVRGVRIA